MRKFVATAAIAASAAAVVLPAAAQAAVTPTASTNIVVCSNTVPSGGGIPNGDPIFVRLVPQTQGGIPAGSAVTVGVQDGQCQTVFLPQPNPQPLVRVKVERLTSAASQKFCGPATGDYNCYGAQNQMGEVSWSDYFSAGRTRGNSIEVVISSNPNNPSSFVTFWTASAW